MQLKNIIFEIHELLLFFVKLLQFLIAQIHPNFTFKILKELLALHIKIIDIIFMNTASSLHRFIVKVTPAQHIFPIAAILMTVTVISILMTVFNIRITSLLVRVPTALLVHSLLLENRHLSIACHLCRYIIFCRPFILCLLLALIFL